MLFPAGIARTANKKQGNIVCLRPKTMNFVLQEKDSIAFLRKHHTEGCLVRRGHTCQSGFVCPSSRRIIAKTSLNF